MLDLLRLIVAFSMFACPLNCSGALHTGEAAESGQSHCSCCAHDSPAEQDAPAGQSDFPADHDCGCENCLCHGAVVNTDRIVPDLVPCDDAIIDPGLSLVASISLASWHRLGWSLAPLDSPIPGRCARILHQSLLL